MRLFMLDVEVYNIFLEYKVGASIMAFFIQKQNLLFCFYKE